jgi:DNA-binding CsgD family transcriptional regulator
VALYGRALERSRIEELLARARARRSGVLVLRGEAGIGKTALLDHAVEQAAGMRVLRATGIEFESELPFSTLDQLVRPVVGLVDTLRAAQARALRTALALESEGPAERFGVYAATLALLAVAADDEPLLCVVDDCQWVDNASAEALAFAARRLEAEGIALLLATRDRRPRAPAAGGLPELRLDGLDPAAAEALLAGGAVLSPGVTSELVAATGGNPLALLELPALLTEEQRTGRDPLDEPLPVSDAIEERFGGQVRSLPASTRRALLIASAGHGARIDVLLRALAADGLDAQSLDAAHEAGLVSSRGGELDFRHPLVRSAVYSGAPPAERRTAHAVLAEVVEGAQAAWHRASAAAGPSEDVAAGLERAGEDARHRGGVVAAARAFQEAARLSPGRAERARRTVAAADEWLRDGDVARAGRLFDEALELSEDPSRKLQILAKQGYLVVQRGDAKAAHDRILEAADELEGKDPGTAAVALSTASSYPLARLDVQALLELSERIEALWGSSGPSAERPKLHIRVSRARILAGRTAAGVEGMLRSARLCETAPATGAAAECAESLVWVEELPVARRLLERELAQARDQGDHLLVAFALYVLVQLELRSGRLLAAYAAGLEAVDLAEQIGQPLQLADNLVALARVEAALGRETDCRAHVTQAFATVDTTAYLGLHAEGRAALGQLALGLDRVDEAISQLEHVATILANGQVSEPGVLLPWAADLIQAYVHAGRRVDGERELAAFEQRSRAAGRKGALALCARCRGLLASEDEYDACFEEALELGEQIDAPLERFRTELCYAERLRRSKRRGTARDRLRRALEAFDPLGETLWAPRARAELAAAGARMGRQTPRPADQLTPQELRIALAVAEGATNREVAARLFLSPKTVEFHLGNVYRRLGIRSRRDLIRLFAREAPVLEAERS